MKKDSAVKKDGAKKDAPPTRTTSISGRFSAMKSEDEGAATPAPPRVSMPMPSPKDRKSTAPKDDDGDDESPTIDTTTDASEEPTRPTRTSVSKPMTPTELPGSPLSKGDS